MFTACKWVASKATSCFRDDDDDDDDDKGFGSKPTPKGEAGCERLKQKQEKGPYTKVDNGDDCSG